MQFSYTHFIFIFHLNPCSFIKLQDVHRYASFLEMLEAESLTKVLPGVQTIEEGIPHVSISSGYAGWWCIYCHFPFCVMETELSQELRVCNC